VGNASLPNSTAAGTFPGDATQPITPPPAAYHPPPRRPQHRRPPGQGRRSRSGAGPRRYRNANAAAGDWLSKLREDQRAAKADVALIVSHALPKGLQTFDHIDGVWVTEPRCAVPVAIALRESLVALWSARFAGEGQQTKMELVYRYLTGPRFKHRIEAIVEHFSDMQADLDRERKATIRLWAKREEQIRAIIDSTAGMYGDLQGIAGRSFQEIEGLEMPLLSLTTTSEVLE